MSKLSYLNTHNLMAAHAHGKHSKSLVVLHETVSGDEKGWGDITGVENSLASKDYGIHGMTDAEGHIAWAYNLGGAVFWQAGGVNEISIGIEQVSNIPALVQNKTLTVAQARAAWLKREAQLEATAKLLAAIHKAWGIPLVYVEGDGKHHGVTSHYSVSKYWSASEGHTDCWPVSNGGYYPTSRVLSLARKYATSPGYTF